MQVHFETYKHTHTDTYPARKPGGQPIVIERYSVEVTIRGNRREVPCSQVFNDNITILGLAVRFQTGSKVWPGTATYWLKTGVVNHLHANIDKRGHLSLVGYFADYEDKAVRSQHNAVA